MLVHKGGKIKNWGGECRDVTPTKSLSQNIRVDVNREVKFCENSKNIFFFLGGGEGGVRSGGGRGDVQAGGGGVQGECVQRIEVFVKIQKKKKIFFWGGGGVGGGTGSGWRGSGWM